MSNNSDRAGLAFGLGLFLGGVAGYFLASDRGRELTSEAGRKLQQIGDDVQHKASNELAHLSGKIDQLLEQSKVVADHVEESVKKGTHDTADRIDSVVEKSVSSFKKGVDKARGNIEAGKES